MNRYSSFHRHRFIWCPSTSHSCFTPLTKLFLLFHGRPPSPTVSSSDADMKHSRTSLSWKHEPSDEPLLESDWPSVHLVLIGNTPNVFVFISCLHPVHLEEGPSVHPTVSVDLSFYAVYQILRPLHRRLLPRYRWFIQWCLFPSFSSF
jgi:hypothetical protein